MLQNLILHELDTIIEAIYEPWAAQNGINFDEKSQNILNTENHIWYQNERLTRRFVARLWPLICAPFIVIVTSLINSTISLLRYYLLFLQGLRLFLRKLTKDAVVNAQREYTILIRGGMLTQIWRAIENGALTQNFVGANHQSALAIAFYAKQFKLFVLLKVYGFSEFNHETPIDIASLPPHEQRAIKYAMHWGLTCVQARKTLKSKLP